MWSTIGGRGISPLAMFRAPVGCTGGSSSWSGRPGNRIADFCAVPGGASSSHIQKHLPLFGPEPRPQIIDRRDARECWVPGEGSGAVEERRRRRPLGLEGADVATTAE